jgi:hypothetical protein
LKNLKSTKIKSFSMEWKKAKERVTLKFTFRNSLIYISVKFLLFLRSYSVKNFMNVIRWV